MTHQWGFYRQSDIGLLSKTALQEAGMTQGRLFYLFTFYVWASVQCFIPGLKPSLKATILDNVSHFPDK